MGNLHKGHASLIDIGKEFKNDVISTIYVNKLQFNDQNDYLRYPKSLDNDKVLSRLILLLNFSKFLSPLIGSAVKPSIPPLNMTTTKFFFVPEFVYPGAPNPAKYKDVNAVVFKKSLLVIFMILRTPDD